MALMAAHGELPLPDAAIFADTQWEPKAVYDHLRWLMSPNVLPFPVHIVTAGNIRENLLRSRTISSATKRFATAPWHIRNPDGSFGIGRRQCTKEFKLEPLQKKQREMAGYQRGQRIPPGTVEVWIGISTDEVFRMREALQKWQINRWPLIEKRMSRGDCITWMERHGYPKPPKSSCIGCPLHNNPHWRDMKQNSPEEFADAVEMDRAIRHAKQMKGDQYMHFSRQPLEQIDLTTVEDHGQLNLFNNECLGLCGV
jgi:hypothetical protein